MAPTTPGTPMSSNFGSRSIRPARSTATRSRGGRSSSCSPRNAQLESRRWRRSAGSKAGAGRRRRRCFAATGMRCLGWRVVTGAHGSLRPFVLRQAQHERHPESGPLPAHLSPFALTPSRAYRGSLSKGECVHGTSWRVCQDPPPSVLRQAQHEREYPIRPTLAHRGPFALSVSKGERAQGASLRVYRDPPRFVLRQAQHERTLERLQAR